MRMMKQVSFVLVLILLSCFHSQGQEVTYEQEVSAILKKARIPAISLAYIEQGEISQNIAIGKKRADGEESVNAKTIFAAASLSKPIVGYMVMQMVEKGIIDLDTPLVHYAPYPGLEQGDWHGKVTPRMVLSHTTGLPNWSKGEKKFLQEPGSKFGYSGEGFVWLQHSLEHLTGLSLQQLAEEYVFAPLHMNNSSYLWEECFHVNHALPHDKFQEVTGHWKPEKENAAASLQTTAEDYALFLIELSSPTLVASATIKEMFREQVAVKSYMDGTESVSWGLGIGIQQTANGTEYWQWGDNGTFRAYFTFSPEQQKGLVYFTTSQNGLGITRDLTDLFIGTPPPGYRWNGYRPLGFWYRVQEMFH